jgi:hypothetical protein
VNVPGGGTTPGSLLVMNDATNLYLAARYLRTSVDSNQSLGVRLDPDDDGGIGNRDDEILLIHGLPLFDYYRTNEPPCGEGLPPGWCFFEDADQGGTVDGSGAFANDGVTSVFELAHPLDSGDVHDVSLLLGSHVGVALSLRMIGPGGVFPEDFGDTDWPGGTDTASFRIVPEAGAGLQGAVALLALAALGLRHGRGS